MIKLTKEQILFQFFGEEEIYPSIQAKAAKLCYGLVKNHAMIDGNKRLVAILC